MSPRDRVLIDGQEMRLLPHAVERYVERVKPHLSYAGAVEELLRMLPFGRFVERPGWVSSKRAEAVYVELSDGIVFPALAGRLITCVDRAAVGAELRVVRGAERRNPNPGAFTRKHKRHSKMKKHGKVARDERRRARAARGAADG